MFAEREDGAVDDQRVVVIETAHDRLENRPVVVTDLVMGDLVEGLASHLDVDVAEGQTPIIGGDESLANDATKREDAPTRRRVVQIGSQHADVVVTDAEAGAQQRLFDALR
jgi:hypothetical protein